MANLPAFLHKLFPRDIAAMLKGRLTVKEAICRMTPGAKKFPQQIQKEFGLTVAPKDPLLALWVAQQEFQEETAAGHQKLLNEFEAALGRSQAMWALRSCAGRPSIAYLL